jgi:norsolorinic acid ketoreductase
MSEQQVALITGAGRGELSIWQAGALAKKTTGIGYALVEAYLVRPNYTVVGSYRDENAPGVAKLKALPKGEGTKLVLVKIDSGVSTDAARAAQEIKAAGIDRIDILIANAGMSPPLAPLETVSTEDVTGTFNINTLGPLALYQACYGLLKASNNPKFVPISSGAGSIGSMPKSSSWIGPAYSISKAALNWITLYVCSQISDFLFSSGTRVSK